MEAETKSHNSRADAIPFLRAVEYLASYPRIEDCPDDGLPVIAFAGRSNSGKSSLLSALCDHKNLARVSRTPGKTRLLNYFTVPEQNFGSGQPAYLVDLPGFGYAKLSMKERRSLRAMVDRFLAECKSIALIVVVLDAKRKLEEEERNILNYCQAHGIECLFARTKWDKLNRKERRERRAAWKKEGIGEYCVAVSSPEKIGLGEILERIRLGA